MLDPLNRLNGRDAFGLVGLRTGRQDKVSLAPPLERQRIRETLENDPDLVRACMLELRLRQKTWLLPKELDILT